MLAYCEVPKSELAVVAAPRHLYIAFKIVIEISSKFKKGNVEWEGKFPDGSRSDTKNVLQMFTYRISSFFPNNQQPTQRQSIL